MSRLILTLTVAALLSPQARAACVALDGDRDNLSADEQEAASQLLEQALIVQGVDRVDREDTEDSGDCDSTWSVSHVRLGESITVTLSGEGESEMMTVGGLEELPDAYARLIVALLTGEAVADTATRDTVTDDEAEGAGRINVERLLYLQLGGGGLYHSVDGGRGGIVAGPGLRSELDRWAFDLGLKVSFSPSEPPEYSHGLFQLQVLRFADGTANSTLYYGGGIGLSGGSGSEDTEKAAPELGVTVGYEFFRATNIRLFTQASLTAPLYSYSLREGTGSEGSVVFADLSLGFAFTRKAQEE